MIPAPQVSIGCLTDPLGCVTAIPDVGGGLARGVASGAAQAIFGAMNLSLSTAADWLVGHVMDLIRATASPDFGKGWFLEQSGLMEMVTTTVLLPILMAASIGPVLRQDGRRLFRVWAVGLPVAVLAGVAGAQLAGSALSATDALCSVFLGDHVTQLASHFSDAMAQSARSTSPIVVQMLMSMLTVAGCILVWLEMMVRSAAIYVTTFFMPLVLVGYIWPATAGMAKRGVEILASLILSKFVIVATLSLGVAAFGGRGADGTIAGAGLLLLAGFAPFALLRLAPVVEAAAIGHLEGLSRRPLRAAARPAIAAAGVPGHPAVQMALARREAQRAGPQGPTPVTPQFIPERAADFPLSGRSPGATGTGPGAGSNA